MNPADYGMTWQEVAEKRLAYIKRLQVDIADMWLTTSECQDPDWFIRKYEQLANRLLREEKTWFGQGTLETEGLPEKLHALIGKRIPWRVDYGDGLPYEIFVGASVEWDFDGNHTWSLVDADRDRWLDYETAMAYLEREV